MEEELREHPLFILSVGLNDRGCLPDVSTILHFCHLLEKLQLTPQVLATIIAGPAHQGLLKADTVVEATIIAAPSTAKHSWGVRDP